MSDKNSTKTDDELVKHFKQGDQKAFDLLVIKYQSRVQAIVGRYLSHEPDSIQDIAQETFIKAYRALPKFRGDSQFYTWLFRIAVNCAKNYLSAQSIRTPVVDISMDDEDFFSDHSALRIDENPESQQIGKETEAKVRKVLDKLPKDLSNIIALREFQGMSYEDISVVMDCPVGTVRSRIFRAREMLMNHLRSSRDE